MDTELDTALATSAAGNVADIGLRGERAYRELKRRLLMGDFALRERLGEQRLAVVLNVSRTPVRQALLRLHSEGLVERSTDGGYVPTTPDLTSIRELYEVRRGLEMQALARPASLGRVHDAAVLEPLRDAWRALQVDLPSADPSFVTVDESFHMELARSAGNAALVEMLGVANQRIRVVRMHDFLTDERVRLTVEEHLSIVEAVLAGDVDLARDRLEFHLGHSLAVVDERATRALLRMVGALKEDV